MNDRIFTIGLISIVLLATSGNAPQGHAQEPNGPGQAGVIEIQPKAKRVLFDAEKMASTVGLLSKPFHVEYEESLLKDLLSEFAESSGVKFRNNVSKQTLVTFKTTASFGTMLGDLLASVECEYAILPNGTIEVRNIPNPS